MLVAVIEADGTIVTQGEWDGKRIDGEYARVNGQLHHCAYVFVAEHAKEISIELQMLKQMVKKAEDLHMKTLMQFGNKYRAR